MEPEVTRRGPGRPPINRTDTSTPMRSEVPRERKRKGNSAQDKFAIPPEMIPEGSSYEWKRRTVHNASDPAYEVDMAEQGWLPVDVKRHPEFMPPGWTGAIERGGLILMERPIQLTQEAQEESEKAARAQVRAKEEQIGIAGNGQFERRNGRDSMASVKASRAAEPLDIPE